MTEIATQTVNIFAFLSLSTVLLIGGFVFTTKKDIKELKDSESERRHNEREQLKQISGITDRLTRIETKIELTLKQQS